MNINYLQPNLTIILDEQSVGFPDEITIISLNDKKCVYKPIINEIITNKEILDKIKVFREKHYHEPIVIICNEDTRNKII